MSYGWRGLQFIPFNFDDDDFSPFHCSVDSDQVSGICDDGLMAKQMQIMGGVEGEVNSFGGDVGGVYLGVVIGVRGDRLDGM